jgi:hypothetical protein
MKFNGSSWSTMGGTINIPTFQDVESMSIAVYAGTPYIAFIDASENNKITVQKWQSNSWVTVGIAGFSHALSFYPKIEFVGSEPHVLYNTNSNLNVQKFNGTNWVYVGGQEFDYGPKGRMAVDGTDIYASGVDAGTPRCYKWDGSTWTMLGGGIGGSSNTTSSQSLAAANGTPYVAYTKNSGGKQATVRYWDGSSWTVSGGAPGWDFTPGEATHISMAMQGTNPYVAFRDNDASNKVSIMRLEAGGWNYVSFPGITPSSADWPDIEIIGTDVYLAFKDNSDWGQVTVYKASVPVGNDIAEENNHPVLYPNPSEGSFQMEFSTLPEAAAITIYNQLGEKILQQEVSQTTTALDLTAHAAGIYFLEVRSNGAIVDLQKVAIY